MRKKIEDKVLDAFESELSKGGVPKEGVAEEEIDMSEEMSQ
jgi:hypothetical protein